MILFSYLAALVNMGIFNEITVSYMIVGHTHDEDCISIFHIFLNEIYFLSKVRATSGVT